MISRWQIFRLAVGAFAATALLSIPAYAATQTVDLDASSSNGSESQCDLNVLQTFPVKIENTITNKAVGDAFNFSWPSAGPGGFSSSVTPGSSGGVGAKWTWTTNQTVYSYTGSTCDKDICFAKTEGPDSIASFCSYACFSDATSLTIAKGATAGNVNLSWTGGTATFTIYRSTSKVGVVDPANAIGTTDTTSFTDTPPANTTVYYAVRGTDCNQRKACQSDAECSSPGDGTCVSRGPFSVPGRSLYTNDVTVSSASLTSSLITFFSPPKEVFTITSQAQPGGTAETVRNNSTAPVTSVTEAYPPGCCPPNPDVPHPLRCGETCVDYLNDPGNCGACGNVCGEGTCCSNGSCTSLCGEGQTWCNGQCVDFQNDNANCGACGNACGEGTCCNGGVCASECSVGDSYCSGGRCADFQDDSTNCGACGVACASGTCCNGGACASLCAEGQTWCNERCADFQNDSNNCGACGNVCGAGTCCNGGTCASVCAEGQVWCNGQCVDFQNDNANCGACGVACGEGTCCGSGTCNSVCAAGQTWCNGQCVDFSNDNGNCGACGIACGEGTCCGGGTCNSVCAEGSVWCNGQCADVQDDSNNCGACGNVCGEGTCCNGGTCASVCAEGQVWCNGQCVDFQNDNANCGACGVACGEGTCCGSGTCNSVCAAGQTWCNGQCVDFSNDNGNCGTCGNVCGDGTCCGNGTCNSVCAEGQTWCNGQCADFQNDSNNCGACGNVCGEGTCCNGGTCASVCAEGQVWCNGQCVDFRSDSDNCGVCGNVCGEGTCCNGGTCASVCGANEVWCNGQCVDLRNDSGNCGACGNACADGTCCNGGSCVSECPAGRTFCNGQCVDLMNDDRNCGTCGHVCREDFGGLDDDGCEHGVCEHDHRSLSGSGPTPAVCPNPKPTTPRAGSCPNLAPTHPVAGNCPNTHPSSGPVPGVCGNPTTVPVAGVCSNTHPTSPVAGVCPNGNPSSGPVPGVCGNPTTVPVAGVCSNTHPTSPVAGVCPNGNPSSGPVDGVCPNEHPSSGPVDAVCPNSSPSFPAPGSCPQPGPAAPTVTETPICEVPATTTTIPPGGSATTCTPGGVLFKEVPTAVLACGDSLPGPDGVCANGVTHVSKGTFMRLVPDTSKTAGAAYITPYAVHVTADTSNDGMLQPGESASLIIEVLNAGTANVGGASATLVGPSVDLTQDGTNNPVGITVTGATSSYGSIQGTQPTTDCTPPVLHPASNAVTFQVSVPADHPGDTAHPFTLNFTGTVNSGSFSMSVPIALGIADRCNFSARTRDYDGVDGLSNPMAKLVPTGDTVPFPSKAFTAGNTRPLKMRVLCGGVNLGDGSVDAPEIVELSEATRGQLDIRALNLNSDNATNPNDPFFRYNNSLSGGQWAYNMRTSQIGTGRFTLTIRIAGRKNYVTGFVLQ